MNSNKRLAKNWNEFLDAEYQEFIEKYGIIDMSELTPEEFVEMNEEYYAFSNGDMRLIYRKEIPF